MIQNAVKRLRNRLGNISQERLAALVGDGVSAITVSRWERGALLPYPRNRMKLAEMAMVNGWWDIAARLDVQVPFAEWAAVLKTNLPEAYRDWLTLGMCALNGPYFDPEDPENATADQLEIACKFRSLQRLGRDLLEHLVELHRSGKETIAPPPDERYANFWWELVEGSHGQD